MGYAIVEEVEVGFRTLTQEERERTAALLEEAALVIDAYGKDADPDVKRLVSCRMVRRLLGDGTGGESIWGKEFENEVSDKMFNFNGAMAMANAGPDTNGSQFFIVQASSIPDGYDALMQQSGFPQEAIDKYNEVGGAPWLDGSYTVFGQVFDGMDVVNKIVEETSGNTDENGIVPEDERAIIESITVAPATDYFNYAE